MATLASPPMAGRPPSVMHRDQKPPSFTAVNGSYQRTSSDGPLLGDTITVQTENQSGYEHAHGASRPTPPPSRQENLYSEYRNGSINQQQLPSPTETSVNSMKRKRSISEDQDPSPTSTSPHTQRAQSKDAQSQNQDDQKYRVQEPRPRSRDGHSEGEQDLNEGEPKQSSQQSRESPGSHLEQFQQNTRPYPDSAVGESDHNGHTYQSMNGGGSRWAPLNSYRTVYQSEASQQTSENTSPGSVQREGSTPQQPQANWNYPPGRTEGVEGEDNNYAEAIHAQLGPKRKRNFSNRTKTGCMTCRKRKKKCDEGQPFCQNCARGGFTCEGYSGRTPWPKPNNPKGPVPLQSKEGFPEHQENGYAQDGQSPHPAQPHLPSMMHGGSIQRVVGQETHEASRGYIPSPASATPGAQSAYPSAWPTNPPYHTDRLPKPDYRDLPPIHSTSRAEPPKEYPSVPPISEISRAPQSATHPINSMQWPSHSPSDSRGPFGNPAVPPPPPPPIDTRTATRPVMSASEPPQQYSHAPDEETEKEKMLRGQLFRYMDKQLKEDRQRCREALWRLNNAGQFGISEPERERLLKDVLIPTKRIAEGTSSAGRVSCQGSIGPHAHVELPFKCHYGYNINIGEDAYIGENCTIIDACKVTIGAKTWIGANVTILTAMAHTDLLHRKGANSDWQGKGVFIEEDVYIGAGSMIYPGVRLARGAYIEPGSIVKEDQGQYGYVGYKPVYLTQTVMP